MDANRIIKATLIWLALLIGLSCLFLSFMYLATNTNLMPFIAMLCFASISWYMIYDITQ